MDTSNQNFREGAYPIRMQNEPPVQSTPLISMKMKA